MIIDGKTSGRLVRVRESDIARLGKHYAGKIGRVIGEPSAGFCEVFWGTWTAVNSLDEIEDAQAP